MEKKQPEVVASFLIELFPYDGGSEDLSIHEREANGGHAPDQRDGRSLVVIGGIVDGIVAEAPRSSCKRALVVLLVLNHAEVTFGGLCHTEVAFH